MFLLVGSPVPIRRVFLSTLVPVLLVLVRNIRRVKFRRVEVRRVLA
jgi:hypothetical protein